MTRQRRVGIGQQKNEMIWGRQDFQPVNYQPQQVNVLRHSGGYGKMLRNNGCHGNVFRHNACLVNI